jgi:hypothetical protein
MFGVRLEAVSRWVTAGLLTSTKTPGGHHRVRLADVHALLTTETPMAANNRHYCPGRCGITVVRSMLACAPCWKRLPQPLRDAVLAAEAIRRRDPADPARIRAHRSTVVAALAWYRHNTSGHPVGHTDPLHRGDTNA